MINRNKPIENDSESFIHILEEIYKKVEELRLSGVSKNEDGWLFGDTSELFNYRERGLEIYFLVYLWYVGILDNDIPSDVLDMTILLNNISDNEEKKKILEIWESINSELHQTFPEWMQIIESYRLNLYRSEKNDIELLKWANGKYLYFLNDGGSEAIRALLCILEQTGSEMSIDKHKKRMLVLGDEEKMYLDLFTGKIDFDQCTLYPQGDYYYCCSLLNTLLLRDNKVQVLKREEDKEIVFPFDEARFDTIYSFYNKKNETNTQYLEDVLKFLDVNGLGFFFYQPYNIRVDNKWNMNYDYPLIASTKDGTLYVCRNSKVQNLVRSVFLGYTSSQIELGTDTIVEHFVKLINNHLIADDYQELTKEDYLYAPANVLLNKIFRQPDQMNFVYRPLSSILSFPDYNYNVPAKDIADYQIIECRSLSDNPFNMNLSPAYYLDSNAIDDTLSEKIKEEYFCIEEDPEWSEILHARFFNEHFMSVAEELAIRDTVDVVSSYDRNFLECRIMRRPGILWDRRNNRLSKVNASVDTPVCYRQCIFFFEEGFGCNYNMREIIISSEYDENFIIYQIITQKRELWDNSFLLVAPTREEQEAYFLKKREEYRLKNAELVNEIRNEERRKISIDLHYLKHDASQYLSKISSAKSLFEKRLTNGMLTLTDEFRSGNTVKDYLEDIGKCVNHVTSFLEQMTFLTDVLPQKPTDISQLLQKLVDNTLTTKKYKVLLELSESMNGIKCLLDERIHKAFDNILSNAERHAFTNKMRKDYKISIKAVKEGDVVIITFSNNGTPPVGTLTEEGFFTRGLHVGPTGHSGFGGSIIRETIEAQNGIVHLHINENKEYPFVVEIKLPVYYD